jgi:CRP/FNR family transcriptional regulator, cyclic AMP receptor protein
MVQLAHNPLEDARRLLGDCVLFRGFVASEKDTLLARARLRRFAPGETIFLIGAPGDSMMAVLSGKVRISVPSPEGREIVLAILSDSEVFGEIAMLDGRERTADARAMTPCTIATIGRHDVLAYFDRHPEAWRRLVELLCARMRLTDQHIAEVALLQLPVRLAKALLRLTVDPAGPAVPPRDAAIQLSQRELGNVVGAARESVNKCLREWQRSGTIRIENGLITIADRGALADLAEEY